MSTECNPESLAFHPLGRRDVVARFDGGRITSDAGGLLLRETERLTGILRQFSACYTDHRDPDRIEHTVEQLIAQRVYGLALGYEDLNEDPQRRRSAARSDAGRAGGEDRSAGQRSASLARQGQSARRQEYPESSGADSDESQREEPVQEDHG